MKHLIMALIGALVLGGAAPAETAKIDLEGMPSGHYQMDKRHASIVWRVSHFGLSHYPARFTRFDVDLNFDAKNPQNSTLAVSIDPMSIHTEFPAPEEEDFDAVLGSDEKWFNGGTFKTITFKSTSITLTGPNKGTVTGDLTLLGVTKPVTLDVTLNGVYKSHPMAGVPALGFSARTTVKRSDFGMSTFVPYVGDDVDVIIEAEFRKDEE